MSTLLKRLVLFFFASLAFSDDDIQIKGTISKTTLIPEHRQLQVMKIKLSQDGKNKLRHRVIQQSKRGGIKFKNSTSKLPEKVELGMGNVPVLDQGPFGTCTTFAITAAIDALIQKGDYISQLCSLSLSQYLSERSYLPSMWQGAKPSAVFNLISNYGFITKENEERYGCGDQHSYPLSFNGSFPKMDIDSFYQYSEPNDTYVILNYMNGAELLEQSSELEQVVENTKKTINAGNRVVLGLLLIGDKNAGDDDIGADGKHHQAHDTWVLSKSKVWDEIDLETPIGGHTMVITGYDDNAEAIDEQGEIHKGLFTLRNSWGPQAGDKGNYYVSYDYFKAWAFDLTKVIQNPFHF